MNYRWQHQPRSTLFKWHQGTVVGTTMVDNFSDSCWHFITYLICLICLEPAGNLLGTCWGPVGNLLGTCWEPAMNLLGTCWEPVGNLLGTCWEPVGNLLGTCKGAKALSNRDKVKYAATYWKFKTRLIDWSHGNSNECIWNNLGRFWLKTFFSFE